MEGVAFVSKPCKSINEAEEVLRRLKNFRARKLVIEWDPADGHFGSLQRSVQRGHRSNRSARSAESEKANGYSMVCVLGSW